MSRNLAGRLLVVDWDYFFPNPLMGEVFAPEHLAYDWHHIENTFYAGPIWHIRPSAFWKIGQELPCTLPHAGFWDRFNLDGDFAALVGDSNMYAGSLFPSIVDLEADGWEEVWLFDAHHDSGYPQEDESGHRRTRTLEEFIERDTMSCEDWMLNHAAQGSKLRVRYPSWRAGVNGSLYHCEPPPAVEVDQALDDGQPVEGWFDAVYVCRSGTWVPPWCDDAFEDFVNGPGAVLDTMWIDEEFPRHRDWDEGLARAEFEAIRDLQAQEMKGRS